MTVAFVSGIAMAFIRFATDRPSPLWVAKLHGFEFPRAGVYGLLTLLVAAAGGLVMNLGYHWKHKPLPEWLVFAHMSVAFIGLVIVGVVTLSLAT